MKIEIHPNPARDVDYRYTKEVVSLLAEYQTEIYLYPPMSPGVEWKPFAESLGASPEPCSHPDLIVVLGGDGSIMRAAHRSAPLGVPMVGVNLGRVGYLAELDPGEIGMIRRVFTGDYRIEKRRMLRVLPMRGGKAVGRERTALNDAVLSHGKVSRLVETELFCGGSPLGRFRSDGFVVSTPTGSTAYSLSAGGPVIDPLLRGFCLVPICPHSLTARPVIVPDSAEVELRYLSPACMKAYLTVDGEESAELSAGDSVKISSSDKTTDLIRFDRDADRNFYRLLREKMSDI